MIFLRMRRVDRARRPAASALAMLATLVALLATAPPRPAAASSCGEITIAEFDWPAAAIAARLLERALVDGYGCAAVRTQASLEPALAALGRADGPPMIALGAPEDAARAAGALIGAQLYQGRERAGWFAPAGLAALYPELRRLVDLPRAAEALRSAGVTARPKLHLCPETWPCHEENLALVALFGLDGPFEIVSPASGAALEASLRDALDADEPWVGFAWTPSASVAEHRLRRLSDDGVSICVEGGRCGEPFAAPPLVIAASPSIAERAPAIAALLNRFAIEPEQMNDALAWRMSDSDVDRAADQLLAQYPQMMSSWLGADAD